MNKGFEASYCETLHSYCETLHSYCETLHSKCETLHSKKALNVKLCIATVKNFDHFFTLGLGTRKDTEYSVKSKC